MTGPQQDLFTGKGAPDGTVAVNARCMVRTQDGHRVVLVAGIVLCQYSAGDRMAEAPGGLPALARAAGYPAGQPRLPRSRERLVSRLKAEGQSNREIARRVGVSEVAIRKLLSRLGWLAPRTDQARLPLAEVADPNLSAPEPADDCPTSFDAEPADRCLDRLFARLGMLDSTTPRRSFAMAVASPGPACSSPSPH